MRDLKRLKINLDNIFLKLNDKEIINFDFGNLKIETIEFSLL